MASRTPRPGFLRALPWLAAAGAVLAGCSKDFSGPYPCNPGFASCTTENSCETDLTSDPRNCGGCNAMCPVGAVCMPAASSSSGSAPTTGTCGAAPLTLSSDVANGTFAINSSYAFFQPGASGVAQSAIDGVSKQGGPDFPVVTQNVQLGTNVLAADDSSVYYLSQNTMPGPACSPIAASPAGPLDAGASSARVVGQQMGQCNIPSSMVLVGSTLFLGVPNGSALEVSRVPTSGGMISPVASFGNVNAFAVDSSNVYAIVTPNGPCEIDSAPSAGGGSASTFISGNALNSVGGGCPWAIASDGTNVYWAGNYSRNRNNDNNGGDQVCVLFVGGTSVGTPAPTLRSSVVVNESPLKMVSDGTNLYLLTNDSLWRFPPDTGATPVRVAGNLGLMTNCGGGGGNSSGCSFPGGGCGSSSQIGLAVDDTSVYVAFENPQGGNQGGTLLKVAK